MNPSEVFLRYFGELERRGIPYVVLHSYDRFPDRVDSDVDCCVADGRLEEALACQQPVAAQCGWVVTQTLQHDVRAFYSVLADPQYPDHWLKLDLCSHYARNHCVFLRDAELLHNHRTFRNFHVPCPSSECLYILVKIFAKGKDAAAHGERLQRLQAQEPTRTHELFGRVFGAEAGRIEDWLTRPVVEWKRLQQLLDQRSRPTVLQRVRGLRRVLGRIARPTGCCIAFLGPDGVGKSTVIAGVHRLLEPHFRREMLIHFIPRFGTATASGPVTSPHGQPPRGTVMSWVKTLYYFACVWLHWLTRQMPARIRSTCIMCDRTFDDLVVDPRRYRVQHSVALVKVLRWLLPRPDITFVLDAPTGVIQGRKAEVSVAETDRQRAVLRQLDAGDPRCVTVSTTATPEEVSRMVCRHVIEWLAARHQRHWARLPAAPGPAQAGPTTTPHG